MKTLKLTFTALLITTGVTQACDSTDGITIPAVQYDRGSGVCKGCLQWGSDIVTNKDNVQRPNMVEYDFNLPAEGQYNLQIEYAAAQSRPANIFVNSALVAKGIGSTTGGWETHTAEFFDEGTHQFRGGANRLRIESPSVFPHLRTISLRCAE